MFFQRKEIEKAFFFTVSIAAISDVSMALVSLVSSVHRHSPPQAHELSDCPQRSPKPHRKDPNRAMATRPGEAGSGRIAWHQWH